MIDEPLTAIKTEHARFAGSNYNQILENYARRTNSSKLAFERALSFLPGGVARSSVFFRPYPIYVKSGRGCYVKDLDGNELIDFQNNFTSLIHGHADPDVIAAVRSQLLNGSAFGSPTELEYELAELVHKRMRSVEKMRFAGSGSEATQFCILAARAYTKRRKIIKFEGAFHGLHESVMVSTHPEYTGKDHSSLSGRGEPDSIAINESTLNNTYALPYNNLDSVEHLLKEDGDAIAAVIVEPVLGVAGQIPATKEFLQGLRELCTHYGVLLIFDEIITGFRLALGGAQEKYHVSADLTALGKLLGGGFPVGGIGGLEDVMKMFDPFEGPKVPCSGTFSANPVTLAAGLSSLSKLRNETYDFIDSKAESIERALARISDKYAFPIRITRAGSLFNFHFVQSEIREHYDLKSENKELKSSLYMSMANRGIMTATRGMCCISTPMCERETQRFTNALEESLDDIQYVCR